MNLKEIELKLALLSEPCPAITPELEEVAISCALGTTQYGSIKGAWWLTTTGYKNGDSAIWVPRRLNASYAFELLSELCEADIAGAFGLVGNCGWVSVNGRTSRPVASLTEEIALAYIAWKKSSQAPIHTPAESKPNNPGPCPYHVTGTHAKHSHNCVYCSKIAKYVKECA